MSGEIAGYLMQKIFDAGALDVYYTPIYMKKNRPAMKLSVICTEDFFDDIQQIILSESTTIGIRVCKTDRVYMDREIVKIATSYGTIGVKVSNYDGINKFYPEYEDCKRVAIENNIPLKEVYDMVIYEYMKSYRV